MASDKNTFVNPFSEGVTYPEFLAAIPKGKTVEQYCKDNLEQSEIDWLVKDLELFQNKKEVAETEIEEEENN